MTIDHYTFVGCTCALEHYINASNAADKQTALDATAELKTVCESILNACKNDSTEETAAEVFNQNVVTVLESIEHIRSTSLYENLDTTLIDLLEHFYNTADSVMGGGGCSDPYSSSSGSSSGIDPWSSSSGSGPWGSSSGSGSGGTSGSSSW